MQTTTQLQLWLDLLRSGDDRARTELIAHACERLRTLTRRMLRGYPSLRCWEQTDDVFQNAMLRLYRALVDVMPDSLAHFYNLAGQQIRRELLDLAKHHARQDGQQEKWRQQQRQELSDEPSSLVEWTEFHRQVEALPDEERQVFSLIWYEELSQGEAAQVLGLSVRTVIRRWQSARVRLARALYGEGSADGQA
jgi:RNA polymerase sigma-70 factor (ECF subfamily)